MSNQGPSKHRHTASVLASTYEVCKQLRHHVLEGLTTQHCQMWEEYGAARDQVIESVGTLCKELQASQLSPRLRQMVGMTLGVFDALRTHAIAAQLLKLCKEFPKAPSRRQPTRACSQHQSFWNANPSMRAVAEAVARLADAVGATVDLPAHRWEQCALVRDLTIAAGLDRVKLEEVWEQNRELWLLLDGQLLTDRPHDPDRGDTYLPAGMSHTSLQGSAYSTTVDELGP